jgi:hypothetical protein
MSFRPALRPNIQWIGGDFSLGVKRPGLEADRSPSANVKVKKTWDYISTPPYVFMM